MNFNERRNVPPPPPPAGADSSSAFTEVTVRTMASDLASLGTGGNLQSQKISVPVSAGSAEKFAASASSPLGQSHVGGQGTAFPSPRASAYVVPEKSEPETHTVRWIIIIIVLAGILFLAGYYLLPIVFP